MVAVLRVYDGAAKVIADMPLPATLRQQIEHNGPGQIELGYPRSSPHAEMLDRDVAYLAIMEDGVVQPHRYVLDDDGEELATQTRQSNTIAAAARGVMAILEWGLVYPDTTVSITGDAATGDDPHFGFVDASPGKIMGTFISRAQKRGCFPALKVSFTDARDSAGAAWPLVYSVTYDAGLNLLTVLQAMMDNGWVDGRMTGFTLDLYAPDTVCDTDKPNAILRLGRDVTKGPRARTRRSIRSTVLGMGDAGLMDELTNATTLAKYGRREIYDGRGGVTDKGTLRAILENDVKLSSAASETITLVIEPAAGGPVPGRDFEVGHRIRFDQRRLDDDTGFEPLKVRSVAVDWADAGSKGVSIELADLWLTTTQRLARKVEGIVGGSSSSGKPPTPTPPGGGTPGTVTKVTVTSLAYSNPTSGGPQAAATVTWPPLTQDADGLAYYRVQCREPDRFSDDDWPDDEAWMKGQNVEGSVAYYSGLDAGGLFQARVAAVNNDGNAGEWAYSDVVRLEADDEPPPQPSTPVVSSRLGTLDVRWDGLGAAGEPMPVDFKILRVHVSNKAGFVPAKNNRFGALRDAGAVVITGKPYGEKQYIKFVAVDSSDNESTPSIQAEGTPTQVVSTDLAGNVIDASHITFKDPGNLIADGSFQVDALTDARVAGTPWKKTGDSWHGVNAVSCDGDARNPKRLQLAAQIPVVSGDTMWSTFAYKGMAGANGSVRLAAVFRLQDGTDSTLFLTTAFTISNEVWQSRIATYLTAPTDAVTMDVYLQAGAQTSGTWVVDAVEVRRVIGTALILDASITTAKINDLAVNNAKIADLEVGKLTSGTISATMVLAGEFRTAQSPARRTVFDSTGIRAFDGNNELVVRLNNDDGNALITGQYRTAIRGRRIVINPTDATTSEIRFYHGDGTTYTYIGSYLDPNWGNIEKIHIGAANDLAGFIELYNNESPDQPGFYARARRGYIQIRAEHGLILQTEDRDLTLSAKGGQFYLNAGPRGHLELVAPQFDGYSTRLQFWNILGRTGLLKYYAETGEEDRFEVKNGIDTGFISVWARAFTVSSDVATKRNLRPVSSALAVLAAAPVYDYDQQSGTGRVRDGENGAAIVAPQPVYTPGRGVLAHQLPPELTRGPDGSRQVDLYAMLATLWQAVRELAGN